MSDVVVVVDKEISVAALADFALSLVVTVLEVVVKLFPQVILNGGGSSETVIIDLHSFNYMDKKITKRMKVQ